jgi:molybdate transport system permease protein
MSWRAADVALEIQIEKHLPEFMLDVAFRAGDDAPLGILGPSGAGKTMLLRCIAGLETPHRGRISLQDRVLFDSERKINVPARLRRVGLLFQHFALFPHRTVAENLAFGLRHLPVAEREKRIAAVARRTHIAGLEHRYPWELSGGEQQRVALARALAVEPEALMLDEPMSSLDTHLRGQIEAQLQQTFEEYGRPALLVTHSMEEAYRLCRRLLVLSRGRVAAFGAMDEIFRRPPTAEVARLTGCKNISRAKPVSEGVVEAAGWGCRVHVAHRIAAPPAFVGIRAHHIDFVESSMPGASVENVFPCWLARSSETPFRITLFLCLRQPKSSGSPEPDDLAAGLREHDAGLRDHDEDSAPHFDVVAPASRRRFSGAAGLREPENAPEFDLQAEVFREKWERFRDQPQPWHVRLSSDALFLMPE